ncbi:PREDICTED: uncharacterized protein LOC105565841 [Vollenhovia emeryi]|uniref:uncharacterized protein LOC105565841 n=1 Tax=Vollenhovia emeryi TaxID=411798 RepID=UPI0005F4ED7D|nr:PREDICTED: uncharacterized protein LOC105565841 [Vollenhovia emeryi]
MNVILIPFFLAAHVVDNDTSDWTLGPEYVYDLIYSYLLKGETGYIQNYYLMNTLHCRPKMPDHLFCSLRNETEVNFVTNRTKKRTTRPENMFEMKFNRKGVEGLIYDPHHMKYVNLQRRIANQFSVLVRPNKIGKPHFTAKENSSIGNCATEYNITREEPETDAHENGGTDFRLEILQLADDKPGTTLLIEKSRSDCINLPGDNEVNVGVVHSKMRRFVSKYKISPNKFESRTDFEGTNVYQFPKSAELPFKEILHINLKGIKPAQNELPTFSSSKLINLNIYNDIESYKSNYLNN